MFIKIKEKLNKNQKLRITLEVLTFPILVIVVNVFVSSIAQLGLYLGTFIRGLFELVV